MYNTASTAPVVTRAVHITQATLAWGGYPETAEEETSFEVIIFLVRGLSFSITGWPSFFEVPFQDLQARAQEFETVCGWGVMGNGPSFISKGSCWFWAFSSRLFVVRAAGQ